MKPIESGVEARFSPSGVYHSDVERLHAATGGTDDIDLMRPYSLTEPLAPLIAAQEQGKIPPNKLAFVGEGDVLPAIG